MSSDKVDKVLEAGASFDWITPLFSLFMFNHELIKVPREYMVEVGIAAERAGVRLRNEQLIGNVYLFDVRRGEWAKVEKVIGW